MKLLALRGLRGSGKDTVATIIRYQCGMWHGDVWIHSFGDPLKEVCAILEGREEGDVASYYTQEGKAEYVPIFGCTRGEKLQRVGYAIRRDDNEAWVKSTMRRVDDADTPLVIVPDARYPNEIAAIRARGGVVWQVVGDPQGQRGDGSRDDNHESETALRDSADFDLTIFNTGTREELVAQVQAAFAHFFS